MFSLFCLERVVEPQQLTHPSVYTEHMSPTVLNHHSKWVVYINILAVLQAALPLKHHDVASVSHSMSLLWNAQAKRSSSIPSSHHSRSIDHIENTTLTGLQLPSQ